MVSVSLYLPSVSVSLYLPSRGGLVPAGVGLDDVEAYVKAKTYCVFNRTRESFLTLNATVADTHLGRLKGLLGRLRLSSDEAIWVVPSQGIHTFGLLFPIDLVYLDDQDRVVHVVENLGPWRLAPIRRSSASVLELPTRTIFSSHTQVGDELLICTPEELGVLVSDRKYREDVAGG